MEDMVSVGVELISIDSPSSLKKMVEVSQNKVMIMGNVPTEVLLGGSKEEIEAAVKGCIDIAAKDSGYVLSAGCAVPLDSPVENIRYFMDAGFKYGLYG
jgi:uroporphyrinogen decarboxylase